MSFNIVDLVKDQVKGQLIGQMGNLLGNEGGKATGAVDSMIPALLNGMTGTANTDEGAGKLFGAIQDQDDSLLDNLGSMLGGGQASTVIDNGNSVLSNLFGSGGLGKLAGALSAFSGVSKGGTSSLMGMLAPIVLGVLKRKVMGDGLNAGGLASMLSSQSNNIGASLPQGLTDQLNTSGFLSGLGGIGGAGAGLAAGAAGAVAAGAANVAGGARDVAGSAAGAVGNATQGAANLAGDARDGVANAAGNVRDGVSNAAGNVRDGVAGAAGSARDGVADAAGNVRDGVSNAAGSARDGVANAAGNVRDGASNVAGTARDSASSVAGAARDGVHGTADAVGHGAKKGGSMFRWLLPLIILAGLAWAAFTYLLPGSKDAATDAASGAAETATESATAVTDTAKDAASTATDAVKETAESATEAAATATDAAADTASDAAASVADALDPSAVGEEVTGLFSSATDTLSGITDVESAQAAIPAFGELGTKLDSVTGMIGNLPEAARGPIGTTAAEGMGKLQPLVDKVLELPGVGAILAPVIGPIMEKMQELGG